MTSTDRPVRRLAELAAIESPSGDRAGLEACYELLAEWAPPGLGTPVRVLRDGVPHLYWEGRPAAGKPVLLLGHADTVWPRGTLAGWPCLVRDGRVTGPGVFDMKAGLVLAMESLAAAGVAGGVRMLVTGDEEVGSLTSRELLEEVARECSAVLVLEPSADGAVKTARKGCGMYQITIEGRAAHAGLEPERGVNALVELAHQVLAIAALGDPERGTTVTPTVAMAGTTVNSVPESARIDVDVRSWHLEELRRVDRALGELRPRLPEAAILRTGGVNRPPLERDLSAGLLETARRVARAAGLPPPAEARVGGGSDGNFTAALGVPTLDGLGPLGGGAHARHEWVDAHAIGERVALVAGVISALVPPG